MRSFIYASTAMSVVTERQGRTGDRRHESAAQRRFLRADASMADRLQNSRDAGST